MSEKIIFDATNQENITAAACDLCIVMKNTMPRVPWLSNSKQQDAFKKIVEMISSGAENLDADQDSKNAVIFWTLTLLYANKKSFQLATASVKNWNSYGISPVALTFVSWVGDNTHPGHVVAASIDSWRK